MVKLQDPADIEAWTQFIGIYQPLLYSIARSRGLQHADADEVTQEVLFSVAKKVHSWAPTEQVGSFRKWLHPVMQSRLVDLYRHEGRQPDQASSGLDALGILDKYSAGLTDQMERERRHAIFLWAAKEVRRDVQPATWEVFWRTAVAGEAAVDVARSLGMTSGAVYVAKSRVMNRIRAAIDGQLSESDLIEEIAQ